ncbi:MAG: hypothetical protein JSW63_01665 [Ignavibacterium sp.]|nr:MAG: hypothetical protein JSW63_01665 [Ignavibacterium sp.]
MIPELRSKFNSEFNDDTYQKFVRELNTHLKYPVDFRIAETPIFLPQELQSELVSACNQLLQQIQTDDFKKRSVNALPSHLEVPNEDSHPQFLQIDFAICKDNGSFIPQLIELQGFPTVYGYQYYLAQLTKKYFDIEKELTPYFSSLDEASYTQKLKDIIISVCDVENVVLLEIKPEEQKTRIDFAATEELLGIAPVCISDVVQEGRKLFYKKNGKLVPIERIYNRVIFDELERGEVSFSFNFHDELDLKWIPHPNWFFKISKYSLPLLKGKYVPDCFFLNELSEYPDDLNNYVLKPLFSFAGHGVDVDLNEEKLKEIDDPENYILQKKIEYEPIIETPDERSKVEIRMMFIWDKEPMLVNNLVRMSKGKMMGVDFNKNKTWVGSSLALHY